MLSPKFVEGRLVQCLGDHRGNRSGRSAPLFLSEQSLLTDEVPGLRHRDRDRVTLLGHSFDQDIAGIDYMERITVLALVEEHIVLLESSDSHLTEQVLTTGVVEAGSQLFPHRANGTRRTDRVGYSLLCQSSTDRPRTASRSTAQIGASISSPARACLIRVPSSDQTWHVFILN